MQRGALELARLQGYRDRTITLPGLGFYGLLLQLDDLSVLGRFADETLGPLRDYDDARKTNLVETLRSYLAHDLSTARTAKALFVHPNTVTLRLKRIESLLGLQLARPESLLQLNAALMAHDIGRVGVDRRT
jgi:DNA-binding PucR family transcriptional regulator